MMAQPKHERKFVYGSVALTSQRGNKYEFEVAEEIQNEIEKLMIDSGYLDIFCPIGFYNTNKIKTEGILQTIKRS